MFCFFKVRFAFFLKKKNIFGCAGPLLLGGLSGDDSRFAVSGPVVAMSSLLTERRL